MWVENMFAYICQSQFEPAGTKARCPSLNFPNHRRHSEIFQRFQLNYYWYLKIYFSLSVLLFDTAAFSLLHRLSSLTQPPGRKLSATGRRRQTLYTRYTRHCPEANSNVNEMLILNPIPILAMTRELVLCSKCPKIFDIPKLIATHLFQCHQI